MRGGSAEPRTGVARTRTGLIPFKPPHKLADWVHIVYITNKIMKTKFTIPPHLFIHRKLAVDISIAGTRWTQLLQSISKNINAYLHNKTIPNNYCWVAPTLCLGKPECSPQGIRNPGLLFSRLNNKNRAFLTSLQESCFDSCSKGSVLIETSQGSSNLFELWNQRDTIMVAGAK